MVIYFPQLLVGELLYSAVARALSLNPASSVAVAAKRFLGNAGKRFGDVLPRNLEALRQNIAGPEFLSEERVLEASLFWSVAPFLATDQLTAFKTGIFNGDQVVNPFVNCRPEYWASCPLCTLDDFQEGRPRCWRTAHQHPGSTVCHKHGTTLIRGSAKISAFPQDCIPSAHQPTSRGKAGSEIEKFIAAQLDWLLKVNRELPGSYRLQRALLDLYPECGSRREFNQNAQIETLSQALAATYGCTQLATLGCSTEVDDNGSYRETWLGNIFYGDRIAALFQRWALLAHFRGLTLADLFERARFLPSENEELESAKQKLLAAKADARRVTRVGVGRNYREEVRFIRYAEPKWLDEYFGTARPDTAGAKCHDELDSRWCEEFEHAFKELIAAQEGQCPKRIFKGTIKSHTGFRNRVWGRDQVHLVRAQKKLSELCETDADYVRRRAAFAAKRFANRGQNIRFSNFKALACIYKVCSRSTAANEAAHTEWSKYWPHSPKR